MNEYAKRMQTKAYCGCALAQDERRLILMRTSFEIFYKKFLHFLRFIASVICRNVIRACQSETAIDDGNRLNFYHNQISIFISICFYYARFSIDVNLLGPFHIDWHTFVNWPTTKMDSVNHDRFIHFVLYPLARQFRCDFNFR